MGRRRNKGDGVVKEGEGKTGKSVQQARTLILLLSLPLPLSLSLSLLHAARTPAIKATIAMRLPKRRIFFTVLPSRCG